MKKVPCPECGQLFPKRGVAVHRRHAHGYTAKRRYRKRRKACPICGEKFDPRGLGQHQKLCAFEKNIKEASQLLVEKNEPTPITVHLYHCIICGQKLGTPPNFCNNCGKDMIAHVDLEEKQ